MSLNTSQAEKASEYNKVISLEESKKEIKDPAQLYNQEELIFSLDIGTRTVVGVLGIQEQDRFKIIATDVIGHKNRAMLDGQIHDIGQVAEVAKTVKDNIEKKTGISLTKVAIAAAGRVLKTCEVKVEREIDPRREIDHEMVKSIEMEGIQKAQLKLDEEIAEDEKTQFYCVGYSVIHYYLNNYMISTLLGHKGKKIGAEVLATFLPHIVVDSLYTVMSKIGLEVVSLTLEPIAAINVAIPKDLRMLNLSLVDIGAGTSDIAITKGGSVVAYAMAPIAGDEITEKIAQHYLVDFNTSEQIKTSLSSKKQNITFVDILGKKNSVKKKEIMEVVQPSIALLAETIAEKIVEYNHKSPNAVFLIGGGSQIPGLPEILADRLKLPKDRVVVRGREIIQNIDIQGKELSGPEAITPFGIAVTAQMQKGQDFMAVAINGKKVRLFNAKQLTVADALILIGFNPNQLIGRTGKSVAFELNGVRKVVRGEVGKIAEIMVNGNPGNVETVLGMGDKIEITPAQDGADAKVKVSDLIKKVRAGKVTFNGSNIEIGTQIYINGMVASSEDSICDGANVQIHEIKTLGDLMQVSEIDHEEYTIVVNGNTTTNDYILNDSDVIECTSKPSKVEEETIGNVQGQEGIEDALCPEGQAEKDIPQEKMDDEGQEPSMPVEVKRPPIQVTVNGNPIQVDANKSQVMFVDIFNYIDFDLSDPRGNVILKLNGKKAGFTDSIKSGDIIDVYWER